MQTTKERRSLRATHCVVTGHWTPARIRKAMLLPKPEGAIDREIGYRGGGTDQETDLDGRHLLAHIANYADVLEVDGTRWLLVSMPPKLMLLLEQLGAEHEDLEDGNDVEDGGDSEPSLGAREAVAQSQWAAGGCDYELDLEEGDADEDDCDGEDDGTAEDWHQRAMLLRPEPNAPAATVVDAP